MLADFSQPLSLLKQRQEAEPPTWVGRELSSRLHLIMCGTYHLQRKPQGNPQTQCRLRVLGPWGLLLSLFFFSEIDVALDRMVFSFTEVHRMEINCQGNGGNFQGKLLMGDFRFSWLWS